MKYTPHHLYVYTLRWPKYRENNKLEQFTNFLIFYLLLDKQKRLRDIYRSFNTRK